ncbi:MAG TPA: hypothetical protein PKD27_09555, partial [Tepidiformaceae bacterium]|nr:hypothetical protein [Tepidiformaceae bacterium]
VWQEEFSPRIRAFCESVRATDFDSLSAPELAQTRQRLVDESTEMFRLTLRVVSTFQAPTFELLDYLEQEMGPTGPVLVGTILQGTANESAASGDSLAELAALAAASPALAAAVGSGDLKAMRSAPGGDAFDTTLQHFLSEYGWRAETWGSLHVPTWAEEPTAVLALVARYLDDPDGGLAASTRRAREQRAVALVEVESQLSGERLETFRQRLRRAEAHVPVSEDRARWQLSLIGVLRLPALALGRKLASAGALDRPGDVFYLTWDDAARAANEPGEWVRAAAAHGLSEFERWERLIHPSPHASPMER